MIEFDEELDYSMRIKVVGIGGAGGTVVDKIQEWGKDVELLAIDTDAKALKQLRLRRKIRIGAGLTKGLGTGGKPDVGRKAIEEDKERLAEMLAGADLVFILAGLGGGAGTGASPAIGELTSELGAISVAVITKPFVFEGLKKMDICEMGIQELRKTCDTIISIPNEELFTQLKTDSFLLNAFDEANRVVLEAVRGIYSLARFPGLINLDFANVRELLRKSGDACFGVGTADGKGCDERAVESALNSPLLQNVDISAGRNILVSVLGGEELRREEVDKISAIVSKRVGPELNTVLGVAIDKQLKRKLTVSIIVTGLPSPVEKKSSLVSGESLSSFAGSQGARKGKVEDELDVPTFLRMERQERKEKKTDS